MTQQSKHGRTHAHNSEPLVAGPPIIDPAIEAVEDTIALLEDGGFHTAAAFVRYFSEHRPALYFVDTTEDGETELVEVRL